MDRTSSSARGRGVANHSKLPQKNATPQPMVSVERGNQHIKQLLGRFPRDIRCEALPALGTSLLIESMYGSTDIGSHCHSIVELLEKADVSLDDLAKVVDFFALLCKSNGTIVRMRTAEEWAAEFLHIPIDHANPTAYFSTAEENAYARKGKWNRLLVLAAAAYAWRLREAHPGYSSPGSLRHIWDSCSEQTREAIVSNTAAYQSHSFSIENVSLAPAAVESLLRKSSLSLPSPT